MTKKLWLSIGASAVVLVVLASLLGSQTTIFQRPRSNTGLTSGIGYGTTQPTAANSGDDPIDGELFSVLDTGDADPITYQYSDVDGAWNEFLMQSSGGDVLVDDELTVTGSATFNVIRDDFERVSAQAFEEDFTAAVTTDAGENILLLSQSQLGVIAYRLEAPGGPGLAATPAPFAVDDFLTLDGYTDDADNEGLELVFGHTGPDHLGASFDEDTGNSVYCEADIDIVDISDTDDVWFGWIVKEAYDNPPASATFDTSALFVISDNAGDLDIETQLNGGGVLNDDTGTTWADLANHVLRVTLSADSVSFTLDGTAVTQTNAVLNLDATDRAVCVFGYTNAAAGDPTVTIDYVEIGVSQ